MTLNGCRRVVLPPSILLSVYVIDRSGTVIWKFLDTDASIRPENEDIVKALTR